MNAEIELESRAGKLILRADKTAFLPVYDALLIADIHFEKASFLQAKGGAPVPGYDSFDNLTRMTEIIKSVKPKTVIALGDSFHDLEAGGRLSDELITSINEVCSKAEFIWVLGNHDPDIPSSICGAREDHVQLGNFLLTHEEVDAGQGVNICGHFHPKIKIKTRRANVTAPCFAWDEGRIILPSFGAFTGGLYVDDKALDGVLAGQRGFAAVTRSGLYRF